MNYWIYEEIIVLKKSSRTYIILSNEVNLLDDPLIMYNLVRGFMMGFFFFVKFWIYLTQILYTRH